MQNTHLPIIGLCLALSIPALSQPLPANEPAIISRLSGEIKIDGIVDEPAWESASRFHLIMQTPTYGKEPTNNSEVFLTYDDNYIYVAARMYDKEPSKIQAVSKKRDEFDPANDYFSVNFDSFNDKENALGFWTTPSGVMVDCAIFNDGQDFTSMNPDWNTFWDVKTSVTEKGWFAEMRIPLSSLRFQEKDNKVTMGLIFDRWIPHINEMNIYPAFSPELGGISFCKPSHAQEVVFEGIHHKTPFYIAPYLIAGQSQENLINSANSGYNLSTKQKLSGGLDLKYGLTQNLTLDLSVNTDFAQVESDDVQFNLTRFSLFFPEKRTFFQERSSNFNFQMGDANNVFYSRRIGLYEDQPVPILGGIRLVGRSGKWDIGFLDMQTQAFKYPTNEYPNLPGQNDGVLQIRRQVFNQYSYVGLIATSVIGADGTYNSVYGLDGIFRIKGDSYLDMKWAQSFDNAYRNKALSLDPSRIWIDLKRRSDKGFGYDLFYGRAGERYQPDLGFEYRSNYSQYGTKLLYGWYPGDSSVLLNHKILLNGQTWIDNTTGQTQSSLVSAGYYISTKSGWVAQILLDHAIENLTDTFAIADPAFVPPSRHSFNYIEGMLNSPPTKLWFMAMFTIGQYYDGSLFSLRLMPTWGIGSSVKLTPAYEVDHIIFPSRNQDFWEHIGRLNALIMFSTKLSISSYIQYSIADHAVSSNIRFRYNPKEGHDFYIVFNEGRNTDLHRETPILPALNSRVILLKYTYTFVL
jgi:hypothetical protein